MITVIVCVSVCAQAHRLIAAIRSFLTLNLVVLIVTFTWVIDIRSVQEKKIAHRCVRSSIRPYITPLFDELFEESE
jgi:hypothetical protein